MSKIRGTLTLDVTVEALAELTALRVVTMLRTPAGTEVYARPEDPDPAGPRRRGHEPGRGTVNESGTDVDWSENPGRWT